MQGSYPCLARSILINCSSNSSSSCLIVSSSVPKCRNCVPDSLDSKKASGKIIICVTSNQDIPTTDRAFAVESVNAKGLILVGENTEDETYNAGSFPLTQVEKHEGHLIFNYMKFSK